MLPEIFVSQNAVLLIQVWHSYLTRPSQIIEVLWKWNHSQYYTYLNLIPAQFHPQVSSFLKGKQSIPPEKAISFSHLTQRVNLNLSYFDCLELLHRKIEQIYSLAAKYLMILRGQAVKIKHVRQVTVNSIQNKNSKKLNHSRIVSLQHYYTFNPFLNGKKEYKK